ncbi:MAG: L,D-transpeptidase family protein [Eggerthellaceae bacterium]
MPQPASPSVDHAHRQNAGRSQARLRKPHRTPALFTSKAPDWFRSSAAANKVFGGVAKEQRWNAFRIALAVIVALLVIYLGGVAHYSKYFYDSSTIGPVDVSGMTEDAAAGALERSAMDYEITVTGDTGSFTLKGAQAGLELDTQVIAANAKALNNAWAWPIAILFPHDYSSALSASVDSDKLNKKVKEKVDEYNKSATAPVNATIVYDKNSSKFVIKKEQEGNTLDADQVTNDVTAAISQLSSNLTLSYNDYEHPTVRSTNENLKKARSEAGTVLKSDLKFQIKGQTVVGLSGTNVADWVTTDDEGNLTLDEDDLEKWVSKVAKKYTTVGGKRTFTRPDGDKITVSGGDYGWDVDEDSLLSTVKDKLMSGAVETIDLPMTQTADSYDPKTGVDWESYIDVDISEQHATYYDKNGKVLWESDVVTGEPGGDTDTSTGVYYINNKESPSVLNGYNLETGTKKYSTKVKYWMPWDGNVIGFHDATWQSAFGGTRYKDGYGSNGCVNLPLKKAKQLYKLVSIGTVVVSHQ